MEFNFGIVNIKIDASLVSISWEITKKAVWKVFLIPHWILAGVTVTTVLANKETFPLRNLFQSIENSVGGDWLKFALEFDTVLLWMLKILCFLMMGIWINRLIRGRDYWYSFSETLIYLLANLGLDSEYPLDRIVYWILNIECYISMHYMNYLIMATPNFSELKFLIHGNHSLIMAVMGTAMILTAVLYNLFSKIGDFLGISDL